MLSTKDGVKDIKVSLENKEGVILFIPGRVTATELAQQIEEMGFDAHVKTVNGKSIENKGNFIS